MKVNINANSYTPVQKTNHTSISGKIYPNKSTNFKNQEII